MLDDLVDFSSYRSDIEYRYAKAEIAEGYNFTIPDVYVPSAGFSIMGGERNEIENVETFISKWTAESTLKHLAVLGEYGQGKTVLALRVAYTLLSNSTHRIPILITLGGRSPRTQSKLGLLAEWASPYDISPSALLALHEAGRLILIFDGFDEMDLVGDASLRLDHFRTLWEFSRERHSKILITGRPNFFLDQLERERSLNVRPESLDVPFTEVIYLAPFNAPKIGLALREFSPDVRKEIMELAGAAETVSSFRDLISRPATLFLAANIWSGLRSIDNPNEMLSAVVIGRFIAQSYERQQKKRLKSFLSVMEREYFTVGIALAAKAESGFSNHISKRSFQRAIAKLIDSFPSDLSGYEPINEQGRSDLKDRLQDRELLIETVSTDVRSCGIIVTDLSQPDAFKFAHKSFFEYLVGSNLIYTRLQLPLSREKILNHAASSAIERQNPTAVRQWILNKEMIQFAGETLYANSGCVGKNDADLDKALISLGLPLRLLKLIARLCYPGFMQAGGVILSVYLQIGLAMTKRLPMRMPFILAVSYRAHGRGGDEFLRYEENLEKAQTSRFFPMEVVGFALGATR